MTTTNNFEPSSLKSSTPLIEEKIQTLREKVLEKKPVLKYIVTKHGQKVLYDYAKEYIEVNINPPIQRRQDDLITTIQKSVSGRLGEDIGQSVAKQLKKYYFVSTTDHHGPICHPFFLNGNLISSATYLENLDPTLSNVIVLACANISLNNSSFPRGLLFHSSIGNQQEMKRISFSPASDRLCPVYGYRPYTTNDTSRIKTELKKLSRENKITEREEQKITEIISSIYESQQVMASTSYSEQLTKTNFELWDKFFTPNHIKAPNLIYIDQESIVAELIISYHLNQDTIINQFLFNPKIEPLIHQYFDGITGAFSLESESGTYFFWALPKGKKYRQQLWKRGTKLVTADGLFSVDLTPQGIAEGLISKQLIPSMLLTFIILAFYYGLKCLGGFSQVNYLTFMKQSYIKMLTDFEYYKSIEVCARSQTKELCGEVTLAFIKDHADRLMPATGLDLILHGNDLTWKQFVELTKNITVSEALNPLMSEFYKIIYPEISRDPELASITPEQITELTGLSKKIKPCASL
ncbi:MAG: hypothetical protein PHW95_04115 [Patescibacteria group bacterium]|nr:hypothetical protein [Patescibacteria group bacterium]